MSGQQINVLVPIALLLLSSAAHAQPTPTPEPAATPAPTPAPRRTPPARPCEPTCRPGFYCKAGECRTLCNPPCAAGEACTDRGLCVPQQTAFPYQPPPGFRPVTPPQVSERVRFAREKRRQRLERRLAPHINVAGGLHFQQHDEYPVTTTSDDTLSQVGGLLGVGVRANVTHWLGGELQLQGVFAQALVTDTGGRSRDQTWAAELGAQAAVLVSTPFGLYGGPTMGAFYRFFGKDALTVFGDRRSLSAHAGFDPQIGAKIGFLLLEEQLDINLGISLGLPDSRPRLLLSMAYHFVPGT